MSGKDRTKEFASAVQTALKTHPPTHRASSMNSTGQLYKDENHHPLLNGVAATNETARPKSQFAVFAKKIALDINSTFSKLERLSVLAKRKSLFDDRPVEIQELTYIIKQDIAQLNNQIAQLQRMQSGTRKREQEKKHSDNVVVSLQSKLASMSKDFKGVLEVRTQNLKDQQERRENYSSGPIVPISSSLESHSDGDSVAIDLAGSNYQQMQLVDQQDAYIQGRSEAVRTIEATIVELGGIFQQLGNLIHAQGELVQRIDANIEDTEQNVTAAHTEIAKYFEGISSNRWLMIKVFSILILFFIVFVVFFA